MSLVENIQRVDLDPIEIGLTYQRLMDEFKLDFDDISIIVGKDRSTVSNYLRLLKHLTDFFQDEIEPQKYYNLEKLLKI